MNSDYRKRTGLAAILMGAILVLALQAPSASARALGMVADNTTASVTIFDADTDTVLGSVTIATAGLAIGDVLITPDQTRGFVTNFNSEVFVIDLTASPPRLAEGTNPIPIANNGEDLSISPDGKFLLVSDGLFTQPISVIDIAKQAEISTLSVGTDTNSVEVCSDGSVLATSSADATVRRLTLSDTGTLRDTGEMLSLGFAEPNNVFCAPDGGSGLVIARGAPEITSFAIPGLERVDMRALSGTSSGISGLVDFAVDRAFARSNGESPGDAGFLDVYRYDAKNATFSNEPLFSVPISNAPEFYGMDQMALHPKKAKLYVSQPDALRVYDANTGTLLTSITDPGIVQPTGVTVAKDFCEDPPPGGMTTEADAPQCAMKSTGSADHPIDGGDQVK
jgi:DNA-binding beta-propeller fold protein YncE